MPSFPVIFINVSSIILVGVVMIYAWKQRSNTGASQLVAACAFMFIWALCSFVEMLVTGIDQKIMWRNITQIGVFYTPPACLMFSAVYSGFSKMTKKRLISLIYGIQTLGILLVFTDQWHHMIRKSIGIVHHQNYDAVIVNTTFLGKILISLNFVYMAAALVLLIIFAIRTDSKMRNQVLITTAGMCIAVIYAILKVISNERFGMIMPISGVFAIVCVTMLLGVFKYDFMTVLPVARKEVFNIIDEGIVVTSPRGEVIDANKAALCLFSDKKRNIEMSAKGFKSIDSIIKEKYPFWHTILKQCRAEKINLSRSVDGNTFFYECNTYILDNSRSRTIGTISLIRDITEQRISHDLLKTRAERDGLTGVYNRLTFIELTKKESEKAKGYVSLIIIDIDDFKRINDNYGHIAGDSVLKQICTCIDRVLPANAILGRIGGEEFSVYVHDADLSSALEIAETLRKNVEKYAFSFSDKTLQVTISIGVVSGNGHKFDQLYQKADRKLYSAKSSGKNCVKS